MCRALQTWCHRRGRTPPRNSRRRRHTCPWSHSAPCYPLRNDHTPMAGSPGNHHLLTAVPAHRSSSARTHNQACRYTIHCQPGTRDSCQYTCTRSALRRNYWKMSRADILPVPLSSGMSLLRNRCNYQWSRREDRGCAYRQDMDFLPMTRKDSNDRQDSRTHSETQDLWGTRQ